ncbi:MAG: M15 family metallopeptidase [Alloprevotella sp.]
MHSGSHILCGLVCLLLTAGTPHLGHTKLYASPGLPSIQPQAVQQPAARHYQPGQVVPESMLKGKAVEGFFTVQPIPDSIFSLMRGKSYKAQCPVPRSDLRYVRCLHRNLEGQALVGELVVNKAIATEVADIFRQLYEQRYPIERMRLVDYYDADDLRSMQANNTSAFNYRRVAHTRKLSKHARGMAVDINPLYNPHCKRLANGQTVTEPPQGQPYSSRTRTFPYKIEKGDACHRLFVQHGFSWGGSWRSSKDYQHFER